MLKLYSKGCQHTLRALLFLPSQPGLDKISAKKLCRRARIPEAYTRKILQALTQQGFLKAVSGPLGGYVLSRDPKTVSLFDVIKAVDGENIFQECVMGLPKCNCRHPCPIHATWLNANKL